MFNHKLRPVRSWTNYCLVPVVLTSLVFGIAIVFGLPESNVGFYFLVLFAYGLPGLYFLIQSMYSNVILDANGLELRQLFGSKRYAWTQLRALSYTSLGNVIAVFEFPSLGTDSIRHFVDLSPYLERWTGSPIQTAVAKYAPQVPIPREFQEYPVSPFWVGAWPIFLQVFGMFIAGPLMAYPFSQSDNASEELLSRTWMFSCIVGALITGARLIPYHTWLTRIGETPQRRRAAIDLYLSPVIAASSAVLVVSVWLRMADSRWLADPRTSEISSVLPLVLPGITASLQARLIQGKPVV